LSLVSWLSLQSIFLKLLILFNVQQFLERTAFSQSSIGENFTTVSKNRRKIILKSLYVSKLSECSEVFDNTTLKCSVKVDLNYMSLQEEKCNENCFGR